MAALRKTDDRPDGEADNTQPTPKRVGVICV